MSERVTPGPICGDVPIREAVCAHTKKVYDSCRSKECIQDLRVYLTRQSQELLERSTSVKPRRAELLWVDVDVQPVDFNRGFFSVDARYFYKIFAEVSAGCGRMQDLCGLAYFDKRAILYGSEGSVRVFSSQSGSPNPKTIERTNKPEAVVDSCAPVLRVESGQRQRLAILCGIGQPVTFIHQFEGEKRLIGVKQQVKENFVAFPHWQ